MAVLHLLGAPGAEVAQGLVAVLDEGLVEAAPQLVDREQGGVGQALVEVDRHVLGRGAAARRAPEARPLGEQLR